MHLYESTPLRTIKVDKRNIQRSKPDDSAADMFIGSREDFDLDVFTGKKKRKGNCTLNY